MNRNISFDNVDHFDPKLVKHLSTHPQAVADPEALGAEFYLIQNPSPGFPDVGLNDPLPQQIVDALNLTLLAEYLETEFYSRGLNTPGLIPNELRPVFVRILLNEVTHRAILLTVLGPRAIPKPTFDFTARGMVPDVFSNLDTFAGLGQTFEDNGVRAIKGQAPNVQSDRFVLTTALRFHSVEARHASELRRLRGQKGWITGNSRGNLPPLAQGVYDGEENTVQGGINVLTVTDYSASTITEAFDEPLTREQVLRNISPFIVGGFTGTSGSRSSASAAPVLA